MSSSDPTSEVELYSSIDFDFTANRTLPVYKMPRVLLVVS